MKEDEKRIIQHLSDPLASEADLHSCIEVLEMLLSSECVLALIDLMQNTGVSYDVRLHAATAVRNMDDPIGRTLMSELANSKSCEIRELIAVALA